MNYTTAQIAEIVGAAYQPSGEERVVCHIAIHTSNIIFPSTTLFAALPGQLSDGHRYVQMAYEQGVRVLLVSHQQATQEMAEADTLVVPDVLAALQSLAKYHRQQHPDLPVVAITGSNGKTVIKEWLYQMLYTDYYIVKSPKSYNSQIGVPLSLFEIDKQHTLGIFEAGISKVGEMDRTAAMIEPTIGIFTNIGDAHDEGFDSRGQKIAEKAKLFARSSVIICCKDQQAVYEQLGQLSAQLIDWSTGSEDSFLYVKNISLVDTPVITIVHGGAEYSYPFGYTDQSSLENILHCITLMTYLGMAPADIAERIGKVSGLEMRLEMKAGLQGSTIINDAYSADLSSMQIALQFMRQQGPAKRKELIVSPLEQSGMMEHEVLDAIAVLAAANDVAQVHYIANTNVKVPQGFRIYRSKAEFFQALPLLDIADKYILVKGSRKARLEDVVYRLSHKGHSTRLSINLDALASNVRVYKSLLSPETEIIAVIKARAYGSGSVEVARLLSQNGVSRLAVAFVDEAITLRKQGVEMPIIVFNADIMSIRDVVRYGLEVEVYAFEQLAMLTGYAETTGSEIKMHLKLDTGMHRLGFTEQQMDDLIAALRGSKLLTLESVFSHLASSEDSTDDQYTEQQFALFDKLYAQLCSALDISPQRHILNSSGITRFPERQYDMVRLGLGLYGIDGGQIVSAKLRKVHCLQSALLQVKPLYKGNSVGYNRKTRLEKDTLTGVVNIGYADGLLRQVGNRKYAVLINGQPADIIGTVSMDLIIVDLSAVPNPEVGDTVTIFDESHPIERLAEAAGTIPYEILSRISERVERIYVRE